MYLVIPHGSLEEYVVEEEGVITTIAQSTGYEYSFTPQIISLPTKEDLDGSGEITTAWSDGEWIYDAKAAQQALGLANILIYRQVVNYDVTENKRINAIPMLRDAGLSEREAFTYAGDIRRGYRSGIDGTVYAASDIYLSITTCGNMYTEIYQDILDAYMRGGKSKKDANTAIKRGLSPHFKSAYLPASATEKSNIRRQMIMSGVYGTAQDVQDTLESWEDAED